MDISDVYASGNKVYAQCRPLYPAELFENVFNCVGARDIAVDVGTGTGQAIRPLAQNFKRVVAADSSPQQLSEAPLLPNVRYVVARAEHLVEDVQLEENSVDLITVATALHWFDRHQFYKQCQTALKPGGCLAAFVYHFWTYQNNPTANAIVTEFHNSVLGRTVAETKEILGSIYGLTLPNDIEFSCYEPFSCRAKITMTVSRCVAFISTLSGYKRYRSSNFDAPDPLIEFCKKTLSALNLDDQEEEFEVEWDFFGFVARKTEA